MTISSGIDNSCNKSASKRKGSSSSAASSECQSRSRIAEAEYSKVAKPWLKLRSSEQPVDQFNGHGLTGPCMPGELVQEARLHQPMLE